MTEYVDRANVSFGDKAPRRGAVQLKRQKTRHRKERSPRTRPYPTPPPLHPLTHSHAVGPEILLSLVPGVPGVANFAARRWHTKIDEKKKAKKKMTVVYKQPRRVKLKIAETGRLGKYATRRFVLLLARFAVFCLFV